MIWIVFLKELKELVRDRKHLLVTILLPILVTPLMMFAVGSLQARAQMEQADTVLSFAVGASDVNPSLIDRLQEHNKLVLQQEGVSDPEAMIRSEQLDLYLRLEQSDDQLIVKALYKETALGVDKTRHIDEVITVYSNELLNQKLVQFGVRPEAVEQFLNPIVLEEENLATTQENLGQALGSFLPFLIVVWIISSAVAISSDLVAGEKERGTLETLIISPVPLLSMLAGKWLTVTLSAWIAGVLTLLSLWASALGITLFLDSEELFELISVLSVASILAGVVVMLPTAGLVSAIMVVSGSVAQSFKEAQSYASGIMMVLFIPMFATMGGTVELNALTALIPIMNTSLAFTELLKGTLNAVYMIPIIFANSVLVFAVLTFAMALYKSEKIFSRQ